MEKEEVQNDVTVEQRLSAPEGTFVEPIIAITPTNEEPIFTPSTLWDYVKDVEGFVMPEGITKDNENELLKPFVSKKLGWADSTQQEVVIHPYAKKVLSIIEQRPEATLTDIAKELGSEIIDISKMGVNELIRMDILDSYGVKSDTNPDGFTEEEIDESIEGMNALQKRQNADLIRQKYELKNKAKQDEYENISKQAFEEQLNNYLEDLNKVETKLFAEMNNVSDIYGIKISQTDLKDYISEFKDFMTPDTTTGIRKWDTWLSNDQTAFKLFVMSVMKGEGTIKELITQEREAGKEDILQRLGLTKPIQGSQGNRVNPLDAKTIEYALSHPDGTIK